MGEWKRLYLQGKHASNNYPWIGNQLEGNPKMIKNRIGDNLIRKIAVLLALTLTISVSLKLFAVRPAFAAPQAEVDRNEIPMNFPESATFSATLTSDSDIQSVVLEYG